MAFKLSLSPTFKTKVLVEIPNDKGGVDKSEFMAIFKRTETEELDALRDMVQKDVLAEKLVGWTGMLDEGNQPVEFTPETLGALCAIPQALSATAMAFWTSFNQGKAKN